MASPLCQITARNVSPLHLHSRPSPSAILAHLPPGMSDHRQKCLPPPPPLPTLCSFLLLNSKDLSFFTCLWIICHLYECLMSHSRPKLDGFSALLFVSLTPPHGPTLSIPLHCPSQFLCCQLTAIIACRITQRFRAPRRSPLNLTQPQPPIHSLAGNTDL